ncbi:MAG: biotin--[acetyl-CoA-carboxylase] ligase [Gemmatimonadetes bacterium]|nr:biotin--[acetyl-CoA-carboxylase] ligase [Gemmatimonadota bacterium]
MPPDAAAAETEAALIHCLGEHGGAASVAVLRAAGVAAAGEGGGDLAAVDRALSALGDADLLQLDGTGHARVGARGSVLSAARVRSGSAAGRYGHQVEVLASVGSTNDAVLERAASGAEPGYVICAELQTEGRGRRGRRFDSRPGLGIWSTVLLDAPADPERAARLSLVTGLAVADAVAERTGAAAQLKWPNDVLIDGRKVCGILVEARTAGGRMFPVAGIGTNVHHRMEDFPPDLRARAGSLESTTGVRVDRSEYLATLLVALERRLAAEAAGTLDLAAEFGSRDALAGRRVEVSTADGPCTGTADGVAPDGTLRVRVGGSRVVFARSGEATLVVR